MAHASCRFSFTITHHTTFCIKVYDYLAALDAEIEGSGPAPFRPAQLSVTDPQAAWCQKNKQARFGYYSNYLIDTEHAIIVGVEATPARPSQEVAAAKTMLERAAKRHGLAPRRLSRHTDEDAREQVRALARTEAYARSRRERKKVEMLFAHLKQQFRFRHLKLRGLSGATEEFLLAATVQNLRRLIRLRPPDALTTCLHETTNEACHRLNRQSTADSGRTILAFIQILCKNDEALSNN